jgi:hypothetical protein
VLGVEPRSRESQSQVISTTFTRPCSSLKPARVPGVEPGSKGSKPPMISITPHPQKSSEFNLNSPSGLELREWGKTGLQFGEYTLIGSNSSAKTTPPTELFPMHFTHLYFAVNREIQIYYKKLSFACDVFGYD